MINGSTCTLSRLGSVTTTTPLSACGHNPIYVDVVFRQLYILAPCCIVYVVD